MVRWACWEGAPAAGERGAEVPSGEVCRVVLAPASRRRAPGAGGMRPGALRVQWAVRQAGGGPISGPRHRHRAQQLARPAGRCCGTSSAATSCSRAAGGCVAQRGGGGSLAHSLAASPSPPAALARPTSRAAPGVVVAWARAGAGSGGRKGSLAQAGAACRRCKCCQNEGRRVQAGACVKWAAPAHSCSLVWLLRRGRHFAHGGMRMPPPPRPLHPRQCYGGTSCSRGAGRTDQSGGPFAAVPSAAGRRRPLSPPDCMPPAAGSPVLVPIPQSCPAWLQRNARRAAGGTAGRAAPRSAAAPVAPGRHKLKLRNARQKLRPRRPPLPPAMPACGRCAAATRRRGAAPGAGRGGRGVCARGHARPRAGWRHRGPTGAAAPSRPALQFLLLPLPQLLATVAALTGRPLWQQAVAERPAGGRRPARRQAALCSGQCSCAAPNCMHAERAAHSQTGPGALAHRGGCFARVAAARVAPGLACWAIGGRTPPDALPAPHPSPWQRPGPRIGRAAAAKPPTTPTR